MPELSLRRLRLGLADLVDERDWRRSALVGEVGAPSLRIGTVDCYVPEESSENWIYLDYQPQSWTVYRKQEQHPNLPQGDGDDPLLRGVRFAGADLDAGMHLTKYGKQLRWGPQWWIDHSTRLTDEQRAIQAQLREIRDSDPSQRPTP